MEDNVIVRIVDLPLSIKGVTIPHPDGSYNIYINAKYDIFTQRNCLKHEMCHIRNLDFDNFDKISIIEKRANENKGRMFLL